MSVGPECTACGAPIISSDDDADVCIKCGGRNRRVRREESVVEVMARITRWTVRRVAAAIEGGK